MKLLFLIILALCAVASHTFAQEVKPFQEVEPSQIKSLDEEYQPGMELYASDRENYQKAYMQMMQELGQFLYTNGLEFTEPTKVFNRIYVGAEGKVDYYLFNFLEGELSPEKHHRFEQLLQEFLQTHPFPYQGRQKFSQCSPIRLK